MDLESLDMEQAMHCLTDLLNQPRFLKNLSIQYIVVPSDVEHELFLSDREYDQTVYAKTVSALRLEKWLREAKNIGGSVVFRVIK